MTETDKPNFYAAVHHALIDCGWSVKELADHIKRPSSSVSRAIHTNKFPLLRQQISKALKLTSTH